MSHFTYLYLFLRLPRIRVESLTSTKASTPKCLNPYKISLKK